MDVLLFEKDDGIWILYKAKNNSEDLSRWKTMMAKERERPWRENERFMIVIMLHLDVARKFF